MRNRVHNEDAKRPKEGYNYVRNWRMFSYVILGMMTICLLYVCYGYWCKKYGECKAAEARRHQEIARQYNLPENIIRRTVQAALSEVKYQPKDEVESCAICDEEFKKGGTITQTQCKHLFHTECIWKWIETKINEAIAQSLELQEQVEFDCVRCPLCNSSFALSGLKARSEAANEISRVLGDEIDLEFTESEQSHSRSSYISS